MQLQLMASVSLWFVRKCEDYVHRYKLWQVGLVIALLIGMSFPIISASRSVNAQSAGRGLTTRIVTEDGQQRLVVISPDRFELHLDAMGIVAWYDLRRDPTRAANLVPAGAHLLEHATADAVWSGGGRMLRMGSPLPWTIPSGQVDRLLSHSAVLCRSRPPCGVTPKP